MAETLELLKAVAKSFIEMNPQGDKSIIIDLQQSVYDLMEQNRQQACRIADLEDELRRTNDLVRDGSTYYVLEKDGTKTGPICPLCYMKDHIVTQLVDLGFGPWACNTCQHNFDLNREE